MAESDALLIKALRMPYNFNDPYVTNGNWETVRRMREEGMTLTIIWVKSEVGVHWAHVDTDGHLSQYPPSHLDTRYHVHQSADYEREIIEFAKKPAVLL